MAVGLKLQPTDIQTTKKEFIMRNLFCIRWMLLFGVLCFFILQNTGISQCRASEAGKVTIEKGDGKFRIEIDGKLFAEYHFKKYAKPIIYPVVGPHSILMTRNYPMKKVKGMKV